jgi:hypothetical protein
MLWEPNEQLKPTNELHERRRESKHKSEPKEHNNCSKPGTNKNEKKRECSKNKPEPRNPNSRTSFASKKKSYNYKRSYKTNARSCWRSTLSIWRNRLLRKTKPINNTRKSATSRTSNCKRRFKDRRLCWRRSSRRKSDNCAISMCPTNIL